MVTVRLRGYGSKSCDPEYSPGKPRDTYGVGSHKITYPTPQYALGNGPDFRIVFYIQRPDAQRSGRYELNVWSIHTILSNIALNNNLINNSLWSSSVNKPKYQLIRNKWNEPILRHDDHFAQVISLSDSRWRMNNS